jgi:predicted nucleic acid-binding protein
MYVLDTNVISEIIKEVPEASVAEWLKTCPIDWVFTTVICQSELLYGVRRLPESRRRHRLQAALGSLFNQVLVGRVLTFGEAAASAYADIRIARERAGRPVAQEDGMIAAIVKIAGATVVTRDETGFAGCGVPVINPWIRSG